jgi:hypothetical protein
MSGYIGPKTADVPVGTISTKGTISGNNIVIGGATVNSTVFTGTANNSTYAFGKTEGNLNVNSAVYANGSYTNTFTVGNSNYFVANGNVGLSTATPNFKLDLRNGRAQFACANEAFSIGLRYNENTNGVWLGSPSANAFQISNAGGGALFNITGNGNVLIPAGNLGVGVSSPNHSIATTVSMAITASGGAQYLLMGNQDSGGVNKPGIIRSFNGGQFEIGFGDSWTNSTGGNFTNVFAVYSPAGTVCLKGGNTSAGGTGITFPTTQSASSDANTLDDYEEGSWTPVFTADTPQTGVTYSSRIGTYTKIGDLVYVRCTILLSSKGTGGSGTVFITGLPFSAAGLANGYAYQTLGGYCYPSSGDTFTAMYGCVYDSGSAIITSSAPGALSTIAWSSYGNISKISFSGTYKIS